MELFVPVLTGENKGGWASSHVGLSDNSDPTAYDEEDMIPLEAFSNPHGSLDLRGLVLITEGYTQVFCNVGVSKGKEFGVDCYVGRLSAYCGDIVFAIREHPIQDGVAQRDERLQALRRLKAPFHTGYLLDRPPFSYPRGVIEAHISCERSDVGIALDMPRGNTATYQELSVFFVYAKP